MRAANLTHGAYGLRLTGLDADSLRRSVPEDWLTIALERRPLDDDNAPTRPHVGPPLDLVFTTGWALRIDREAGSIVFFAPSDAADDELVHPYLAPAAIRFAGWRGQSALHGGAFLHEGKAWGVLAARTGGKSTTLGRLTVRGVPVLADDLFVSDGEVVFAGPRCIDLRPSAAAMLDCSTEDVRMGERRRLRLDPVVASAPLGGLFVLEWADSVRLEPLSVAVRVRELARRFRTGEQHAAGLLDLAGLPVWRAARPRGRAALDDLCERLLDAAAH